MGFRFSMQRVRIFYFLHSLHMDVESPKEGVLTSRVSYNPETKEISPLIEEQTQQIFLNIEVLLREGGATMKDIVRIRYVLKDISEWKDCRRVLRRWLGAVRPASSVQQAIMLDDMVRIEVEVTARKTGQLHNYAD